MPSAPRKKESLVSLTTKEMSGSKKRGVQQEQQLMASSSFSVSSAAKGKHRASSSSKDADRQMQELLGRFCDEANASLSSAYESIQAKRRRIGGESRVAIKAQSEALKGALASNTTKAEALASSSDGIAAQLAAALQQLAEEGQRLNKCGRSPELDTASAKVREELKRDMAKVRAKVEAEGK